MSISFGDMPVVFVVLQAHIDGLAKLLAVAIVALLKVHSAWLVRYVMLEGSSSRTQL